MSNTPATNDSQPPGDPTTAKGGAWSRDDVFRLLEELLEARRNREFLKPSDKPPITLHPSKKKTWNQKRMRNKHDDLAGTYKQWVTASKYSGCHADRMTGKLEYDPKEMPGSFRTASRLDTLLCPRVFRRRCWSCTCSFPFCSP
ncbi:hypothetical protein E4U31_002779 [Claviceps sp. LM219 group G6]|nr:hypothetical protein E4U31_002779 [Claviceps sp. LM219 group G6]